MKSKLCMSGLTIILTILTVIIMSGCSGNWKSTHNTTDFVGNDKKKSKIISVDAKQRFGVIDELGNFCAEPSPDAISALASAFGLNISNPTGGTSGNLTGNSVESVASIGLRTQSIQLMRDAMYRICELKKNGALNNTSAYMLHSGYQDVMIALLSIEQLTGPVKASQAALGGHSDTAVKQTINKLDKLIEDLNEEKGKLETERQNAEDEKGLALKEQEKAQSDYDSALGKADDAGSAGQLDTAKETLAKKTLILEEKDATLSNIISEIESIDSQLTLAKDSRNIFNSINSSTASQATLGAALYASTVNDNTVTKIAESVENIAKAAINRDRITPACIIYLTDLSTKVTSERLEQAQLLNDIAAKKRAPENKVSGQEASFDEGIKVASKMDLSLTKATEEINAMRKICEQWVNLKYSPQIGNDAGKQQKKAN